MLDKILDFIKDAGDYAKSNQINVSFSGSRLKSSQAGDVVTETDLEVSRRFQSFVEREFGDLGYVIVDEESFGKLGATPMAEIKRHEYAFIIDPIDGTLTYANGLPYYGVSIGVFRHQRPLLGAIYAPSLNLLAYADQKAAFVEENGKKREISNLSRGEVAALYTNTAYHEEDAAQRAKMEMYRLATYSAAVSCIYVGIGKLRGWTFQGSIWDLAGACAIFAHTGVKIFDTTTDRAVDLFDDDNFDTELRVKEPKIVCLPKYYRAFKKLYKL